MATSAPEPSELLLALVAILASAKTLGFIARKLGQPRVIGELVAGVLLGPSLFGLAAPAAYAHVFPPAVFPALGVLAQLGVLLFLFTVGLRLDLDALRRES